MPSSGKRAISLDERGVGAVAAAPRTRERLWTGQFVLLLASAVFMYVMTFMLTPTLPLFAQDVGAGTTAAGGVIVAAYTLGSLLPRLVWGRLADSWGRRAVYLLGLVIMTVISPFYPVVSVLPLIIGLRLIQGIGFSGASTSAATAAADLVPSSRRSEGIGYYALANTIGMAVGPNLGLALHQSLGSGWLFAASTASGILALATGLWLRYERTRPRHQPSAAPTPPPAHRRGPGRLIEKSVLPVCVVFLFVVMPYGAIMAYVAAYGLHQHVGDVGLYFTVFALALLVVRLGVGRITDRYGMTVVFVPGIVVMFAGLLILGWATTLAVFLVSAALFGLGYGVTLPLLQSAAYAIAPPDRRGVASATVFATADIAYGLGAVLLGIAIQVLGYPIAFADLAGFVILALVLFFVLLYPKIRHRQRT